MGIEDIEQKPCERKRELKNGCLRCRGELDPAIIECRTNNARQQSNTDHYHRKLSNIIWECEEIDAKKCEDSERYHAKNSDHSKAIRCHGTSFVALLRQVARKYCC